MERSLRDIADEVKSRLSIEDVVGEYVRLQKKGSGRMAGLCPFHSEKTPSFSVNIAHQFYKCFGCGAGGDVIQFVQQIEGSTFWEVLLDLGERCGVQVKTTKNDDKQIAKRQQVRSVLEVAQAYFVESIDPVLSSFVQDRKLTKETVAEFGIGYCTNSLRKRIEESSASSESAYDAKLLTATGHVAFANRITFPIHSEAGKLVGFGARATGTMVPKYLNSAESDLYSKSDLLYNLHRAKQAIRESRMAYLVEGYMDVIALWQAGIHNVVACCGTALTRQQAAKLRRHADTVILAFDGDTAGVAARSRAIPLLLEQLITPQVMFFGDLDPDEWIRMHGTLKNASVTPGLSWLVTRAYYHAGSDVAAQRRAASDVAEQLSVITDDSLREELERNISREFGMAIALKHKPTSEVRRNMQHDLPLEQAAFLNALVTVADRPDASYLIDALRQLIGSVPQAVQPFVEVILDLKHEGIPVTVTAVCAACPTDEAADTFQRILADQESIAPEQALLAVVGALQHFDMQAFEAMRDTIRQRIIIADRHGQADEAKALLEQLGQMDVVAWRK